MTTATVQEALVQRLTTGPALSHEDAEMFWYLLAQGSERTHGDGRDLVGAMSTKLAYGIPVTREEVTAFRQSLSVAP